MEDADMKKAIVLVLMLLLTLALAACGANGTQDSDSFTVGEAPSGAEGAALARFAVSRGEF